MIVSEWGAKAEGKIEKRWPLLAEERGLRYSLTHVSSSSRVGGIERRSHGEETIQGFY